MGFFGEDEALLGEYCWYVDNAKLITHRVGSLKPNDFGLFDTYGNVFEWCQGSKDDAWPEYGERIEDADSEGMRPVTREFRRVLRGGSFVLPAFTQRSAYRSFQRPGNELFTVGFRLARTIK